MITGCVDWCRDGLWGDEGVALALTAKIHKHRETFTQPVRMQIAGAGHTRVSRTERKVIPGSPGANKVRGLSGVSLSTTHATGPVVASQNCAGKKHCKGR